MPRSEKPRSSWLRPASLRSSELWSPKGRYVKTFELAQAGSKICPRRLDAACRP